MKSSAALFLHRHRTHDGIQYSSTPSDVTLLNHICYSVIPVFASSFLPFSFMVFLLIFVPSPQFFWSIRPSLPFLFWWPHCGCTLKTCPNYWESSLVRSNSLELWVFLLNYAICFSRHWRPGGPAFNISMHVQQKEKEGKIKRRGQWWSEGKMCVCACVFGLWGLYGIVGCCFFRLISYRHLNWNAITNTAFIEE